MSQLVLVRHGQASLFAADYDVLSPLGEEQSRCLGRYWLRSGVPFDAVYVGPRRRQQATARRVADVMEEAGCPWPTPTVVPGLDEYDGDGVLAACLPALVERDERIRRLAVAEAEYRDHPDRSRHYHRLFEAVMSEWQRGAVDSGAVETWRAFHDRVHAAWRGILRAEQGGRRVAVFTSGGPIAIAVQLATQAPEAVALDLNWRIRNASLTDIVFARDRVTLDSFNTVPHLDDPALWSYR